MTNETRPESHQATMYRELQEEAVAEEKRETEIRYVAHQFAGRPVAVRVPKLRPGYRYVEHQFGGLVAARDPKAAS